MDQAGRLTIERGTEFGGYTGYGGLEAKGVLSLDETYYEHGFKATLMQFSDCHFKEFGITGLKFTSNVGYEYTE